MADQEGDKESKPESSMQESWVDVQQGEGKLVHNRSKEELEKLLASAASEEEMSDSDTVFKVSFKPTSTSESVEEEEEDEEEDIKPKEKQVPSTAEISTARLIPRPEIAASERHSESQSSCSLLWCVPVFILTHLAMFGIGYYLGRRTVVEPSLKLLHV